MTYKQLEKYLCECCKNNVPISYKSLKTEVQENKEDIKVESFANISNRWRRSNVMFSRGKKLYRFNNVFISEIYKKDTADSKNTLVFYMIPTDDTNEQIYILGVTKYAWSYELKALNKEQLETYVTEVRPNKR